ncbi:MAG TPA: hypothetical protein VFN41_11730 [Candidatus Limnocylindrales bacterium]|nr:hypothetical protein [Candidatus Limnocylindrales bacterium]
MTEHPLDAFPDRSVAMVRAFSVLERALLICATVAIVIAIVVTPFVADRVPAPQVLIAAVAAVLGVGAAHASVPTELRRAFEAYSWLGRAEIDRFKARTGSSVPTKPADIDRWLASTPVTPETRLARIEVLAFIGRYDEARAELADVGPTTPQERFEVASLRQYIDWLASGEYDKTDLTFAAGALPHGSLERRMADVNLALADARVRWMERDPAWSTSLQAVRSSLGRDASMVVVRDTWSKFAGIAFVVALVVSTGVMLLA